MSAIEIYKNVQSAGKFEFKVNNHVRFVKRIANSFKRKIPQSLCIDDLIQVGLIALVEISHKYDETTGKTFENFASSRVKGAMIDLIRENTPLSKEKMSLIKYATCFIDDYVINHGRKPKESIIAEHLQISIEKYQSLILEYESVFHVDITDVSVFDTGVLLPENLIDEEKTKRLLIESLKMLNDREQKLIALYFMEELTQSEIASVLSITESRVSQMMKATLVKLRKMLKPTSTALDIIEY